MHFKLLYVYWLAKNDCGIDNSKQTKADLKAKIKTRRLFQHINLNRLNTEYWICKSFEFIRHFCTR